MSGKVDELMALAKAALQGVTPGPWTWDGDTFSDAPEYKCPHGTQWCDHGPDLVRGNPDGSTFEEFDQANMVITSNGYDASGLEIRTADAEFIMNTRGLVPDLLDAVEELDAVLFQIEEARIDYEAALRNREHGAVAVNRFIGAVRDVLDSHREKEI